MNKPMAFRSTPNIPLPMDFVFTDLEYVRRHIGKLMQDQNKTNNWDDIHVAMQELEDFKLHKESKHEQQIDGNECDEDEIKLK